MNTLMVKAVRAVYDALVGTHPYRKGGTFNNGIQFTDEFGKSYTVEIIIKEVK